MGIKQNLYRQIVKLHEYYSIHSLPENLSDIIKDETGVDLTCTYIDLPLRHPVIVAPGQLTTNEHQIQNIFKAGYSGCVLKSVVGESPDGSCSMSAQRKKATYIHTFYESNDPKGEYPIIHWDGRCDPRPLEEYLKFARLVKAKFENRDFALIASILCNLPPPDHDFIKEEWFNTTKAIYNCGYRHIEIDFCPYLSSGDAAEDLENVLRWYRNVPRLVKQAAGNIRVVPKLLNLEAGLEFQVSMAEAAIEGGADGIVVANRIYKPEYKSAHGGEELRHRNIHQIREIKKRHPSLAVSATGGVYNGEHAFEYLQAGADNVQILSSIMGKVKVPFYKRNGSKFEQVLHKILLNPDNGLVMSMLKNQAGV